MIQHFISSDISPEFRSETVPRLYYMGNILTEISSYPRLLHSHDDFVEISIIYSGQSEYLIQDRKQLIQAGDILIYNSSSVHDELSGTASQVGSYFFAIGNLHVPGLRENALIPDACSPVFHVGQDFPSVLQLCEAMLATRHSDTEYSSCIRHFSTQALLEIIWRVIQRSPGNMNVSASDSTGKEIKRYIDAHFREPIALRDICVALHMSESYVSHEFKRLMGYSPVQYLLRRKIGEAQTLLISTDHSITDIAHMVGYDSPSHFNQRFLKYVGISPSRFRQNYKRYDCLTENAPRPL